MSKRWYQEKKREHFYKEAKKTGYRARSAFKLKQIQKRFNVIRSGDVIVDLGAAPGGWSQVSRELVGEKGFIIGVDLLSIKPVDGVVFFKGDLTDKVTIDRIIDCLEDRSVDVVLSDMSPNISGNYNVDQARSVFLCEKALDVADVLLRSGGSFVCKVFEGEDFKDFYSKVSMRFKVVKIFNPLASRKSSSEVYIIGKCRKN